METFRLFSPARLTVDAPGLECVLRENRPLRLSRARGLVVRCTAGRAWITAPGMSDDIILQAGQEWRVGSHALVLVEAIGSAAVAIFPRRDA
ncbi:MAG TPA: DUF2917 domain-containing protein [Rhodocyclaceae bacterium]